MVQTDTGRFLNELGRLFEKAKAKDSVRITLKRSNLKSQKSKKPNEEAQFVCLVRATDGNKKISTTVTAKDYSRFQESYATILKAHMDALKRREKTKAKPAGKKA